MTRASLACNPVATLRHTCPVRRDVPADRPRARPPERIVMRWPPSVGVRVAGAGVELVLQDDRRGLAIDAGPRWASPLGAARRAPRTATLHRAETLLGEMAGQTLVTIADRRREERPPRRDPLPRDRGLAPLPARDVERQADDELRDVLRPGELRDRRRVAGRVLVPAEGRQRRRRPSASASATPIRRSPRSSPRRRVTARPMPGRRAPRA